MILHVPTGLFYVGSSYRWLDRCKGHAANMRRRKHPVPAINRLVRRYGLSSFRFMVLEECGSAYGLPLFKREHRWIREMKPKLNAPPTSGTAGARQAALKAWRRIGCTVEDLLTRK